MLGCFLGLLDRLDVLRMVGAVAAVALGPAHFARGKTLAVHLETASLFAVAASLL